LACVSKGFDYVAEDFVGLERHPNNSFVGHSLYNSLFLEGAGFARFRAFNRYAIESRFSHDEKAVVILSEIAPAQLMRAVPIVALALPCAVVGSAKPTYRRASKVEALLALGPSSLLQIPNRSLGVLGFDGLADLVGGVRCYRLELGSSSAAVASSMRALLKEVRSSCALETQERKPAFNY
jgi:hypothetical protein